MNGRSRLAQWSRRPWLVVATVGLIAGLGFALLTPPLAGYDEPVHFLRANQVAQGQLIATRHGKRLGGDVPVAMRNDLAGLLIQLNALVNHGPNPPRSPATYLHHLGAPAARGPKAFVDFPSSAVYSPVPYAPAAILMAIGHLLGASTLLLLYLGRIGSLLGTIGLLVLATKRMPTRRWALATVALAPVTVVQAAMLSADGVTLALTLLVLALALDVAATPRGAVSRGRWVEIFVATVALGFAKPPYILIALAFAIPWRRQTRSARRALVAAVAAGVAAAASWGAYAASVYVAPVLPKSFAPLGISQFAAYTNVDPRRQERFMLHHPWYFVQTMGRTLSTYWTHLLRESVAQVPLWLLPAAFAIVAFAVIAAGATAPDDRSDAVLGWRSRVLLAGIAAFTFVTLMVLAYTGWNAVGSPRVEAFQGRYLLPLIPLALLALPARRSSPATATETRLGILLVPVSAVLLTAVGFAMAIHLY